VIRTEWAESNQLRNGKTSQTNLRQTILVPISQLGDIMQQQTYEKIHKGIVDIQEELDCSMWDAALEFCERFVIEPEDLPSMVDKITLQKLKLSAEHNMLIRRMHRQVTTNKLPLE
jgi:hypothetical protein